MYDYRASPREKKNAYKDVFDTSNDSFFSDTYVSTRFMREQVCPSERNTTIWDRIVPRAIARAMSGVSL